VLAALRGNAEHPGFLEDFSPRALRVSRAHDSHVQTRNLDVGNGASDRSSRRDPPCVEQASNVVIHASADRQPESVSPQALKRLS
jgi:hypothetical protein